MSENTNTIRNILGVLSVTTLASFLTGLNARLTVVGIPDIARSLGAGVQEVIWITQGYMLGSIFMQPLIGRLSDLYGRVRLFNLGFLLFTIGALFSGLSDSSYLVILSRIIQGIGAAPLITLSITILTDNVPSSMLATWLGVNQVAWRIGAVLGMTISGIVIDVLGWKWIFLIQVPIGLAAFIYGSLRLRDVYRPVEKPVFDLAGFTLFTASVTLVLMGLTFTTYGLGFKEYAVAMIAASIVMLIALIPLELRHGSPILDLKLFKNWGFTGGIISQFLYSIGFGGSLVLLSIYLQTVKGYNASTAGLLLVPFELGFLVAGLLGGKLADKYGYTTIIVPGLLTASIALYILSTLTIDSSLIHLISGMILLGIGAGLFTGPNTSSIMASVPPHRRGAASSLRTIMFNIGFALSLNLALISMTMVVPYTVASSLIAGEGSGGSIELGKVGELALGIGNSFRIQSMIMLSALFFSIGRLRVRRRGG